MATVFVDSVQFAGALESSLPEDPERGYTRQGSTLQCMPGLTTAGKTIHVDNGLDESSGTISLNLQYVTQSRLDVIVAKYKTAGPVTVQVGDLRGNEWTCVYKPNTQSVKWVQHNHFPGVYRVTIDLNIIEKTSGSVP
jgi:hypothetical protein